MAEIEKELKNLLMRVEQWSEQIDLKLSIQKTTIIYPVSSLCVK